MYSILSYIRNVIPDQIDTQLYTREFVFCIQLKRENAILKKQTHQNQKTIREKDGSVRVLIFSICSSSGSIRGQFFIYIFFYVRAG